MYISSYITDEFITTVIINNNPIEVLDLNFIKLPYIADISKRPLIKENILKLLEKNLRSREMLKQHNLNFKDLKPIFVVSSKYPTNINSIATKQEILSRIPHNIIEINQFSEKLSEFVSDKYLNDFINYSTYKLNLPKDIKLQTDLTYLTYFIKNNKDIFTNNSNSIIMTPLKYSEIKILEYAISVVKQFANVIKKPSVYEFNIDYVYGLIPIVAALTNFNVDIKEFFKTHPLSPDAKLVIAPEVEKYEILSSTIGQLAKSKKTETVNLRPNSLNIIQLKENEKVYISYKSKHVKFSGTLTGSRTDVYFDNRSPNAK